MMAEASETVAVIPFRDTPSGRMIVRCALESLGTHMAIAQQILTLMLMDQESVGVMQAEVASQHVSEIQESIASEQGWGKRESVFDVRHESKTRRAYTSKGNPNQESVSALAPAQRKILLALLKSPKPLDVSELTQSCQLQKKTVTNALSLLKSRKLIDALDKK